MTQPKPPFFYRLTHGIRITVRPEYLADQSDPTRHRFVFAYHVRIENVGIQPAQLLTRRLPLDFKSRFNRCRSVRISAALW